MARKSANSLACLSVSPSNPLKFLISSIENLILSKPHYRVIMVHDAPYSPFCSPARTEGDCCTQRTALPFPLTGTFLICLFREFGVPISPNGFCRLIIRWGFPKAASDLITRQIYGCDLDLQKNNLQICF